MSYFNPSENIKKIETETGISNVAPKPSIREGQPVKKKPLTAAQKKAKQRQYFKDRGEGIPPHLQ